MNQPSGTLAIVRGMPAPQREPRFLEGMLAALADAPSAEAEEFLFKLAEGDPRFYLDYYWRAAVLRRGTQSSARRLVDVAAKGMLQIGGTNDTALVRELGGLMGEHPDLRAHVYELLRVGLTTSGLALLARGVAENPDEEGLLLLVKQSPLLITWRTTERVITEHVPAENWEGAYNIAPIAVVELRRKLLAMTTDGSSSDAAAQCLKLIDRSRDEYGAPEAEPRHPDLGSGKPWAIIEPRLGGG